MSSNFGRCVILGDKKTELIFPIPPPGQQGCGKTRLLHHLTDTARASGIPVSYLDCRTTVADSPALAGFVITHAVAQVGCFSRVESFSVLELLAGYVCVVYTL